MKHKYAVILTAHGNIDYGQNPYSEIAESKVAYGNTLEELQIHVRQYIAYNALGSGQYTGGKVYEVITGAVMGYISYNGRFWDRKEMEAIVN